MAVSIGVLGAWLMASPFVLGAPPVDAWNDVIVGGALALLAGHNYASDRERGKPSQWIAGVLVLFSVWLLLAPFVFGVSGALRWNDVVVGVLVTAFGSYSAFAAQFIETVGQPSTDEI